MPKYKRKTNNNKEIIKKKNKGGQPTKYLPIYAIQVYEITRNFGFDNKKLCKVFDICNKTLNNWMQNNEEFLLAVIKGKDEYDSRNVETSLLKRAIGYDYKEKHVTRGIKGDTIKIIDRHIPPETGACMNWLSNRSKDRWGNTNLSPDNPIPQINIQINNLSIDEIEELKRLRQKATPGIIETSS